MKKMVMGIVAMMMAFGTMTMNANNAVKNDKNNHGKNAVVVNNHGHNKGHNDKGHNDAWGHNKGHNDKGMYHMNHAKPKGHVYAHNAWFHNMHKGPMGRNYINVFHCMHGYKVNAPAHHHVYAYELINGHATGHVICIYCAKHKHLH